MSELLYAKHWHGGFCLKVSTCMRLKGARRAVMLHEQESCGGLPFQS